MSDIEWMNTEETARRLGITTRTLYRFMDQGRLPAYRFGRVFRLKLSDVDKFIEESRVEPGTLSHLYPDPTSGEPSSAASTEAGEPRKASQQGADPSPSGTT